ncbi:origin recognition complex subunit [Grosmannia clavigera kw1407]|uniref:Origin recognition complex subunit 1 n=1 Tax=Grosmannia clavigera (strain kw1407 / UAMH 11150) TaxID=655863 RepID=F0XMH9_GROCL|nr:origin recognition complex subunit [Grosmannia clavigera kw1407]EFX01327.1 origin recognition complex subunit [Grosmannia clavigera kw1407]
MPLLKPSKKLSRKPRTRKIVPGILREDSDDELGDSDLPWEWIYENASTTAEPNGREASQKRKRSEKSSRIIGARMGEFECRHGDTVLLKAEGSNEAWVGLICDFLEEDDQKKAHFMWFSTEREIRNKIKKRTDFLPNELYISPSWDYNPLASINGRAQIMSLATFYQKYPNGRVPRNAKENGKVFVCRRGCNTRTASYTEEFVWEDLFSGSAEDIENLVEMIKTGTKATRKKRQTAKDEDAEDPYVFAGDDEGAEEREFQTPKKKTKTFEATTPTSKAPRSASKFMTPSHRRVMVKKQLEFTPLATRTLSPGHFQASPFQRARAQLHVASVPTSLPCRESEFSLVYSHLEAAITEGTGSCIYISGTPGTGKTATVREVVAQLDCAVQSDELDDFIFVEINGMKITDPHQSYSLLWEALKGQRVSPGQALDLLEHEFSNPSPRRVPCVVLMDELDQLVTKNQGVMYNFFNWPSLRHSRLIVLAVANTMDLPERTLSNKISSRLGLTRITFPGYNHEQLMKIIQSRLEGVPGSMVDPDAIQFASRKVAAVSGDARRALDICRRAVELAEAESRQAPVPGTPTKPKRGETSLTVAATSSKRSNSSGRVTIDTVRRAIAEATSSPLQQYLRALPFASRLLLAALVARAQRTGLAESTYGDVLEETERSLRMAMAMAAGTAEGRPLEVLGGADAKAGADGSRKHTGGAAAAAASRGVRLAGLGGAAADLAGAGILYLEGQRVERPSKMRLAVGDEDVRLAFRDDPEIKATGLVA